MSAGVVVLGGSLAGMHTAMLLAERGVDVTVLERDAGRPTDDPLLWDRPGTPQLQHSHAFLGRYVAHLRARCPGLLDSLMDAGATLCRRADHLPPGIVDRASRVDEDDQVVLGCRRAVLDAVVRRHVTAHPRITLETGVCARGLMMSPGDVPHVAGVLTDAGPREASLVVDASGRRTKVPRWLADDGVQIDDGEAAPCGNVYYTRHYRTRPGAQRPTYLAGFVEPGTLDALALVSFPGEHDAYSVSIQIEDDDVELRLLKDPRAFQAAASQLPRFATRVDPANADALSPVFVMAGLQNRLRRLVVDEQPAVTGVVLVGDALCVTNPTFGRGSGHSVIVAEAVADLFGGRADGALTSAVDAATVAGVAPYFRNALAQDVLTRSRWRQRLYGEAPDVDPALLNHAVGWERAFLAGLTDREVWSAVGRAANLLRPPQDVLDDPDIAARVDAALAAGPPAFPPAPTRADLLAAAKAAVA